MINYNLQPIIDVFNKQITTRMSPELNMTPQEYKQNPLVWLRQTNFQGQDVLQYQVGPDNNSLYIMIPTENARQDLVESLDNFNLKDAANEFTSLLVMGLVDMTINSYSITASQTETTTERKTALYQVFGYSWFLLYTLSQEPSFLHTSFGKSLVNNQSVSQFLDRPNKLAVKHTRNLLASLDVAHMIINDPDTDFKIKTSINMPIIQEAQKWVNNFLVFMMNHAEQSVKLVTQTQTKDATQEEMMEGFYSYAFEFAFYEMLNALMVNTQQVDEFNQFTQNAINFSTSDQKQLDLQGMTTILTPLTYAAPSMVKDCLKTESDKE